MYLLLAAHLLCCDFRRVQIWNAVLQPTKVFCSFSSIVVRRMRRAVQSLILHSLIASALMMGPYVGVAGPPSAGITCSIICRTCDIGKG
jgi:hypothetical protein